MIRVDKRDPILRNLKANILFESLAISHNYPSVDTTTNLISIATMNVHINGIFNITNNQCRQVIAHF